MINERLYTIFKKNLKKQDSHQRKNKILTLGPQDTIKEMIN